MKRKIVNLSEYQVECSLKMSASENSARVYSKVRLADVVEIHANDPLWKYATMCHLDNVVVDDLTHEPLFAVEFDGSGHNMSGNARERDEKKNGLCKSHDLPLIRFRDEMLVAHRGSDLVRWLCELFFRERDLSEYYGEERDHRTG